MATTGVESTLAARVGAAAGAAWGTVLVAALIVTVQAFAYMAVAHCEASRTWLSDMMGMDWGTLRDLLCAFILAVRFAVLLMLLACIWLSLWARRLRRLGDA